jgi:hypothetical protein
MNICAPLSEVPDTTIGITAPPERPTPVLFTDEDALCDWIANAVPGAVMIYYRGHLAYDRMPSTGVFANPDRKRLIAVAKRAMQAAEDGLIHLVQRRHGPQDYSYIAIKARGRVTGRTVPPRATAGR